jgi:ABC-2 type transport system permease protein
MTTPTTPAAPAVRSQAVRAPVPRANARRSPSWIVSDSITLGWRNMLAVVRNPQLLVIDTITPIMFVLLFAFVFGGAISTPGMDYVTFLMPGIFVQTVVFGGSSTAIGLAEDMQKGIIDRFRSLPMAPSGVLIGRTFADLLRNGYTVVVMTIVGFLIGFRFKGSWAEFGLALLLIVFFGYSISWLSANIGLRAKTAQAAQGAIFIPVFPLTFASSAFVPVATMPGWLRPIAEANPVTVVVNAARGLILGAPDGATVLAAVAWIVGIVAVFAPIAIWSYRRHG